VKPVTNWSKLRILIALAVGLSGPGSGAQRLADLSTPAPIAPGATLVIGFLGGYDRWDDGKRGVRQLVLKLRSVPGVYAESISNHRRSVAMALIERSFGPGRSISADVGTTPRIILFGQSWGGAAAIQTARDLERRGIPVLLTVQVDSVGLRDDVIPANVHRAANFYQHDRFTTIHGRREIHAADPSRTTILGNFETSYSSRSVDQSNASRARQIFGGSHTKMELDPLVWNQVERLISDAIARRLP
jgi:hypothetical protein